MLRKTQKKVGVKLPKALQDELVSLGKLGPGRSGKRRRDWEKSRPDRHTESKWIKARVNDECRDSSAGPPRNVPRQGTKPILGPKVEISDDSGVTSELGDDDDLEIAQLEKKLGLDKKKASKKVGDGLDDLLDSISSASRVVKRKRQPESSHSRDITPAASNISMSFPGDEDENDEEEFSEFEGFSDSSANAQESSTSQAPVALGRYLPPAARKAEIQSLPAREQDLRLQKQMQGTLNRLSEANMSTILAEIENLYRTHPRADVTSTLTSLLLTILTAPQTLLDTFLILHAGFVAALYRIIGIDFAAHLVQTIIERFDQVYPEAGKDGINLIVFLSELYNFGVVGCGLIYDLIRMFLEKLDDYDTELLLKLIQNSGQQLRQDDPSALKDIVILMQSRVALKDTVSLSVRTKFMIDTIINLKNNRAKAATATSVVTSEATVRMKKFLGKMGEKSLRSGSEPVRVSLSDIRNVKEKGKWWLVGASWRNDELNLAPEENIEPAAEEELLSRAREQRMNTEIRRTVFIALMGSEDCVDAATRILLLPLKKAQRNEIPRVLVHCCSNESVYNPFYALVARRLCSPSSNPQVARVVRMGLQFNLWGAFREWGENTESEWSEDLDEMHDDKAKLRKAINLGKFYGSLVVDNVVSLQMLKVLGFINLQSVTKTFLEVFFTHIILHSQGDNPVSRKAEPLLDSIYKLEGNNVLAKGIDWYLRKKNVENARLANGEGAACVVWGVGILRKGISEILAEK